MHILGFVYGISCRQPEPWAVIEAGSRILNRRWAPRAAPDHRGPILLHASAREPTGEWMDSIARMTQRGLAEAVIDGVAHGSGPRVPAREHLARGGFVAQVHLVNVVRTLPTACRVLIGRSGEPCLLCGKTQVTGCCEKPDPWAVPGTLGLMIAHVEPAVDVITFKGLLGLYNVPDELVASVRFLGPRP